jgi:hypothetical protein
MHCQQHFFQFGYDFQVSFVLSFWIQVGIVSMSNRIQHPVQNLWTGELIWLHACFPGG